MTQSCRAATPPPDKATTSLRPVLAKRPAPRVWSVVGQLLRHPFRSFIKEWNWKAAVLSCVLRVPIYIATTFKSGWHAVAVAGLVEASFTTAAAGIHRRRLAVDCASCGYGCAGCPRASPYAHAASVRRRCCVVRGLHRVVRLQLVQHAPRNAAGRLGSAAFRLRYLGLATVDREVHWGTVCALVARRAAMVRRSDLMPYRSIVGTCG